MNDNVNPYEIVKAKYESNVDSFILSDLFQPNFEVDNELINDIKDNEIVIYTAFTGGYDSLKEPQFKDDNVRYVCFTQDSNLKSDTWDIIRMEDSTLDDNRIAKQYKVFPNKYFPDDKYSFWIDGSFKIKGSIREYIYKYVNSSMLTVVHPERDCIYDEAAQSLPHPRYSNFTITKQVEKYRSEGMPAHYGLPVLGAIFRKHNDPEIVSLMNQWWEEIINYTNQDQLSFTYLMWKNDFHPSVGAVYYWDNEYWAIDNQEYHHNVKVEDYITSRNLIKSLEGNIKETNTLTKEEITLLFNDIDALRDEAEALNQNRDYWDRQINNVRDSTSWKLTSKLRNLKNKGD
ncbi:glycosyltransferase domain-containing protein [uncultured Methanobrevibacter sp.]|uniref:glycosyltransferase domain-containing protein n=1 Tax=uncultured Methanobrevibacter sp. TaxID=253161 RepID=UPI0025F5FBF4|nr:glycosyltransferase domain-containing protein [uncultured Methanobrevibacter sp.]